MACDDYAKNKEEKKQTNKNKEKNHHQILDITVRIQTMKLAIARAHYFVSFFL